MRASGASSGRARFRAQAALVLVGAAFVWPAVMTALGRGFGISRNDDQAYAGAFRILVGEGRFVLASSTRMTLVGQLVLAWPLGKVSTAPAALQLGTLAFGLVGVAAVAWAASTVLDRWTSVLVALSVVVTPLWIPLVASFMTDIWAFSLSALALALVVRSTEQGNRRFLLYCGGALGAASWATMTRQVTAAALVAVVVGMAWALRPNTATGLDLRSRRRGASALVVATAGIVLGLYLWRSSMPLDANDASGMDLAQLTRPVRSADRMLVSLSLLLLPTTLAVIPTRIILRRARAHRAYAVGSGVVVTALLAIAAVRRSFDEVALNDYVSRFGPATIFAPQVQVPVLPGWLWVAILGAGLADLWVLGVVLVGSRQDRLDRMGTGWTLTGVVAATFVAAFFVLLVIGWITGGVAFDRYLLPVVPWCALLVALSVRSAGNARPLWIPGWPRRIRVVAIAVLLLVTSWLGYASAAFDREVWDAASAAAQRFDVPASAVDAGVPWNAAQLDGSIAPYTADLPGTRTDRCVVVRQTSDRSDVVGPVLEHSKRLWVERWFYADVRPAGRCPGLEPQP